MDKRYQVFVSSTYADLKDERQRVIQTLMELDCIPAGMELFPAFDEQQWDFIKRIIDDCDYYILIIGGRYGSTTDDGISYTEKEFDYAVEKGLKVIAFVHGSPEDISIGKSEMDNELREKLIAFRTKVTATRLVKYWEHSKELSGLVALSLTKTIKMYPAIGWVRANQIANESILQEINELRKLNDVLLEKNTELMKNNQETVDLGGLADFDSQFNITIEYKSNDYSRSTSYKHSITISWKNLFMLLAPTLLTRPNNILVRRTLADILMATEDRRGRDAVVSNHDFETISIQLQAYSLVKIQSLRAENGKFYLFWSLTPKGEKTMIESRIIKKDSSL